MKEQVTKKYKHVQELQNDLQAMQRDGWVLISQTSHKEQFNKSKGCCLGVIFLPLMIMGSGKSYIVATFEREKK